MPIRFPKPLRGWRAFLDEILIVVVGVFIALAAQQWVEDRSWSGRVSVAREALSQEVDSHYANALEWRLVEPCVTGQLDRLAERLVSPGTSPAPTFMDNGRAFTLRTPNRPYVDSSWRAAVTEGVSSRMPTDERLDYGAHFDRVVEMKRLNDRFTDLSARLNSLSRPVVLDPTSRVTFLTAIDEARDLNYWQGLVAEQLIAGVARMRLIPDANAIRQIAAESGTAAFCNQQRLPVRPLNEALEARE